MKKLMIMLCVLFPSIAFAADNPTAVVVNDMLSIVLYTVSIVAVGLLGLVAKWVAARFKISIPDAWLTTMDSYIDKAIHYAEEWASNKIKASETVTGNEKLNTAMSFLLKIIGDDKKLVTMTEEQIKKLIEARLGEHRSIGVSNMGSELATFGETKTFEPPPPLDATHMSVSENGAATLYLTNGDTININDLLARAGYTRLSNPPTSVAQTQGGFMKLSVMLTLSVIALLFIAACAGLTKKDATQIGKNGVNCTVGELFERAKEMAPSVEANIKMTIDSATGKPNWDQAQASIGGFKSDVAGCALAMAVDAIMHLTSGSGFAPLAVDRKALADGYEAVRKAQFGDRTFIVSTEAK